MDFLAHSEESLHWGGGGPSASKNSVIFPSKKDFQMMVHSYLDNNMGLKLPPDTDFMDKLWFFEDSFQSWNAADPEVDNWQRGNLWTLIQDNEYIFSKLYSNLDVFPSLYGTCGGLYVVEALEPLSYPGIRCIARNARRA
jgi:hypothetical protein